MFLTVLSFEPIEQAHYRHLLLVLMEFWLASHTHESLGQNKILFLATMIVCYCPHKFSSENK